MAGDPVDDVVHHAGWLIAAALNAHSSGWCAAVLECKPYEGMPNPKFPALAIWADKESFKRRGTNAEMQRHPTLSAIYTLGPVQTTRIVIATAVVREAVGVIWDVLEDEKLATYESGDGLYKLAGVTGIGLTSVQYLGGAEEYPGATLTIECEHLHARSTGPAVAIADILGALDANLDLDPSTVAYDTDKTLSLTPLKLGARAVCVPGSALAVTESNDVVTMTVVAGTTTVAALIAKIATVPGAAAVLSLSGTAGTIPVVFAGFDVELGRPRTRQSSDTT